MVVIEVFEHLIGLRAFFGEDVRLHETSGVVIDVIGAINAIPAGSRAVWHYVAMPEPMVFMSSELANHFFHAFGLQLLKCERYRDGAVSVRQSVRVMARSWLSEILRQLQWQMLPRGQRRGVGRTSVTTRDLCLVGWEEVGVNMNPVTQPDSLECLRETIS